MTQRLSQFPQHWRSESPRRARHSALRWRYTIVGTLRKLYDGLRRQLKRNASRNLLHRRTADLLEVDATFLAAVEELLAIPTGGLDSAAGQELAAHTAAGLIERIYILNQYLQIDGAPADLDEGGVIGLSRVMVLDACVSVFGGLTGTRVGSLAIDSEESGGYYWGNDPVN